MGKYLSPEARILEIGGGAGNCAKKLSELGFSLTCIDLSEERVLQAKQRPVPKIQFKVGDAPALDFPPDTFDIVFSHQMIEHLHPEDISRHLDEVFRVLKKADSITSQPQIAFGGPRMFPIFSDSKRLEECT